MTSSINFCIFLLREPGSQQRVRQWPRGLYPLCLCSQGSPVLWVSAPALAFLYSFPPKCAPLPSPPIQLRLPPASPQLGDPCEASVVSRFMLEGRVDVFLLRLGASRGPTRFCISPISPDGGGGGQTLAGELLPTFWL